MQRRLSPAHASCVICPHPWGPAGMHLDSSGGMPNRSWLAAPLIAVVGSMGCSGSTTSNPGAPTTGNLVRLRRLGRGDLGHTSPSSRRWAAASRRWGQRVLVPDRRHERVCLVTSYDGNTDSTAIVKAPLSGGAAVTLATDPSTLGLALSGGALYWVDPSGRPTSTPLRGRPASS